MTQFFLVMLGGGIGAVIRAFVTNFFNNRINSTYPIATLVVNILGSFLIGLLMGLALNISWINTFLIVGVLGGLTTFSTLSSELVQMLTTNKHVFHFIVYSILQYVVSFVACLLGYFMV